ncbi:MAG: CopD family protein [Chloroflexi bacterium]|nr:CopD family protein [Chloroflexota bacterium]
MDWVTTALLYIHVATAVIWLGSAAFLSHVMMPSLRHFAPPLAGQVMVTVAPRANRVMLTSAIVVLLSGGLLVLRMLGIGGLEDLFKTDWGRSIFLGILLTLGMFLIGVFIQTPAIAHLQRLGQAGGPPPAEEAARLQRRLRSFGIIAVALGFLALLEMVIARGFHV